MHTQTHNPNAHPNAHQNAHPNAHRGSATVLRPVSEAVCEDAIDRPILSISDLDL